MTGNERITRARSAIGQGIRYLMSAGGRHPEDALPTRSGKCDCSGFVAWVCGWDRKQAKPLAWYDTTRIWSDARGPHVRYFEVAEPAPGDIAVWPTSRTAKGKRIQGHVAMVVSFDGGVLTIIDCASSTKGITEHDGGRFLRHADMIWCRPEEE